jgi:hypothetical protein
LALRKLFPGPAQMMAPAADCNWSGKGEFATVDRSTPALSHRCAGRDTVPQPRSDLAVHRPLGRKFRPVPTRLDPSCSCHPKDSTTLYAPRC